MTCAGLFFQVSTVLQFRNMDYAMEHCVLHFEIPQGGRHLEPDIRLVPDPSEVDVWVLDMETEMSRHIRGSMDYAPARKHLLTTLRMSMTGQSQSEMFECRSGMYTTVELACSTGERGCDVDFWQSKRAKPIGGELCRHTLH